MFAHGTPKLQLRSKNVPSLPGADADSPHDSKSPFGIPIYEHLRSLKAQEAKRSQGSESGPQLHQPSTKQLPSKKRKTTPAPPQVLLCEKYRPTNFFDLCGNDDANRQVLRWMNYWKSVVFGTEPILNEYTDRLGRPQRKILLLNGPPGTGKTTAAHVIAQQSGFDVLEINASDERGAAVVQDRIVSAIQSHQVHRRRPVCIVADEVEGASEHGFIRALVNIINEDAIALSRPHQNSGSKNKSKKKKKKHSLLLRPIIAVCNNAWASSLHNLRPHAEIINFHRQSPGRLVKRLEEICFTERIKLTTRDLVKVVDVNNFDLRSCLNALQFGALHSGLDADEMESIEMTKWDSLLKLQFQAKNPASFKQLESCSDMDKLIVGCFTAYPDTGFNDDLLKKPALLGDYLALADNPRSGDDLKTLTVHACGHLFRSPSLAAQGSSSSSVQYGGSWSFGRPPSTFETHRQTKGILQSVLKRSSNVVKTTITEKSALLELLPLAVNISSPKLSTVPNAEEKVRVALIANILREIGVSLRSEKLENGTYIHRLDPPIHQACIIDEKEQLEASGGSYISRGQIKDALRELKLQEERLLTQSSQAVSTKPVQVVTKAPAPKPIVDFRDFFRSSPGESATQIERESEEKNNRVWVQYSEGFSNAVRKNITWDELFKF